MLKREKNKYIEHFCFPLPTSSKKKRMKICYVSCCNLSSTLDNQLDLIKKELEELKANNKGIQIIQKIQIIQINLNLFNYLNEVKLTEENFHKENRKLAEKLGVGFIGLDLLRTQGGLGLKAEQLRKLRIPKGEDKRFKFLPLNNEIKMYLDRKDGNGFDLAFDFFSKNAENMANEFIRHFLKGSFKTKKRTLSFYYNDEEKPYFLKRDLKKNQVMVARAGEKARTLDKWNFDKSLITNLYIGSSKKEAISLTFYNKKFETKKRLERLEEVTEETDFTGPDHHWRGEIRIRGKEITNELLESYNEGGEIELRRRLVDLKDEIIFFFSISDKRSLASKKKSTKPAAFWIELSKLIMDKDKMLIIDRGESLEDIEKMKEIRENLPLFIELQKEVQESRGEKNLLE